jgi:hypothetical protein
VSKTNQKTDRGGQPAAPGLGEIAVPEQVIVSMTEIAESAREGLLALAVSTGLQVMTVSGEEGIRPPYRTLDCLKPPWDNVPSKVEAWR